MMPSLRLLALAAASLLIATSAVAGTQLIGIGSNGGVTAIDAATASVTTIGPVTGLIDADVIGGFELGPDGFYYAHSTGSAPKLFRIDPDTWSATLVAPLAVGFCTEGGLAIAPNGAAWFANVGANPPILHRVDLNTGAVTSIAPIGNQNIDLNGLDIRGDGQLVGLDSVSGTLITIDPQTALTAPLGNAPGMLGSSGGMTIVGGVGYYCTAGPGAATPGSNRLFQFDPFTGVTTNLGSFSGMMAFEGFFGLASGEAPVGTTYCSGDGSGATCPCGNVGGFGIGCANSSGSGASLFGDGSTSVLQDDLVLTCLGMPAQKPSLLFVGTQQVNGGAGALFGDGLRCVGGPIQRLGVQVSDAGGAATWGPNLAPAGGWSAGDLRRFQVWYRDTAGPCATGFNLSQGIEIVFAP